MGCRLDLEDNGAVLPLQRVGEAPICRIWLPVWVKGSRLWSTLWSLSRDSLHCANMLELPI